MNPTQPPDHRPALAGRVIGGHWRIGSLLGAGATGWVFAVEDIDEQGRVRADTSDVPRAIKIALAPDSLDEVRWAKQLHHSNIVRYWDFGILRDQKPSELGLLRAGDPDDRPGRAFYLVMDRAEPPATLADVTGEDLGASVTPLPAAEAERLWQCLDAALTYLASSSRVHGDIKPANTLRFVKGGETTWALSDFGIGVELRTGETRRTIRGRTPAYQSPRAVMHGRTGPPDDRYSAALVVHRAATGEFPGGDPSAPVLATALPESLRFPLISALTYGEHAPSSDRAVSQVGPLHDPLALATTVQRMDTTETNDVDDRPRRRWLLPLAILLAVGSLAGAWLLFGSSQGGDNTSADAADAGSAGSPEAAPSTEPSDPSDGGPVVTAVASPSAPEGSSGEATSPGSKQVLLTRRSGSATSIVRLDLASGDQSVESMDVVDPREASVSGDLKTIVIVAGESGRGTLEIGAVESPAFRSFDLGSGVSDPTLSPDGSRVAYTTSAGGSKDVAVLDLATGATRQLLSGSADEFDPAWSPDGQSVAAVRAGSSGDLILVVDADSGDRRTVADGAGSKASPSWSPDSSRLSYVAESSGGRDVFTVSSEGGEPEIYRLTTGDELDASWCGAGIVASSASGGLKLLGATPADDRQLTDAAGDGDPACA